MWIKLDIQNEEKETEKTAIESDSHHMPQDNGRTTETSVTQFSSIGKCKKYLTHLYI